MIKITDYNRHSFFVKKYDGNLYYYIKVGRQYVEVNKEVYKTIYNSFKRNKYNCIREASRLSTFNCEASFFCVLNDSIPNQIKARELLKLIMDAINGMRGNYKVVGYLYFIKELSITEISKILNISKSSVVYYKDKVYDEIVKIYRNY